MATSVDDANRMIAAGAKNGKILQIGQQSRYNLLYVKMVQLVREGRIGDVEFVNGNIYRADWYFCLYGQSAGPVARLMVLAGTKGILETTTELNKVSNLEARSQTGVDRRRRLGAKRHQRARIGSRPGHWHVSGVPRFCE
jgi:hypothetical protein